MKRFLSMLCLFAALLCLFPTISSNASNGVTLTALRGTPVLDGCMDPIYASSCNFKIGLNSNYVGINPENDPDDSLKISQGDCYVLWDSNYLYFYCTAYDSDLQDDDSISIYFQTEDGTYFAIAYYSREGGGRTVGRVFLVYRAPSRYRFGVGDGQGVPRGRGRHDAEKSLFLRPRGRDARHDPADRKRHLWGSPHGAGGCKRDLGSQRVQDEV